MEDVGNICFFEGLGYVGIDVALSLIQFTLQTSRRRIRTNVEEDRRRGVKGFQRHNRLEMEIFT